MRRETTENGMTGSMKNGQRKTDNQPSTLRIDLIGCQLSV